MTGKGRARAWAAAIRPRSLAVAVSPVLAGAALAFEREGRLDAVVAMLVLGAALLMQLVTNLQNDAGYTVRGGDAGGTRVGLPRATANGWLSVRAVRGAIIGLVLAATAVGVILFALRGWPVLAIGCASLLAALAYMGGPRPIAYTPFGELTVLVFFGLVAVPGTDWALGGEVGLPSLIAGAALGSLAAAALAVNNHRDRDHDRSVGRRTFAVIFGEVASRRLFDVLLLAPFSLVPALAATAGAPTLLAPLLLLPAALKLRRDFRRVADAGAFTPLLLRSFELQARFALLLGAGALIDAWCC